VPFPLGKVRPKWTGFVVLAVKLQWLCVLPDCLVVDQMERRRSSKFQGAWSGRYALGLMQLGAVLPLRKSSNESASTHQEPLRVRGKVE
jgi:hypothetical protein